MSRHGRQTRLAEVGAAGQARIAAATVDVVVDGLAAEVATRYLVGAGVGCVRVREGTLVGVAAAVDPAVRVERVGAVAGGGPPGGARGAPETDAFDFRDPGARAVAQGAREALRALRTALERGCDS
jgi:hypothetical protein